MKTSAVIQSTNLYLNLDFGIRLSTGLNPDVLGMFFPPKIGKIIGYLGMKIP